MNTAKEYIKTLLKLAINNNPEVLKVIRNSKTVVKNATEDAQGNLHSESTGQFVSKGSNSFFEKWNDAPVIELKPTSWEHISDIKELRKEAKKYFHSNLQGQNLTREGLKNIRISGKSFDEFFHISADPDKLKSVPQILELIEKGKLGEFEPDEKGRTDYIRGFHPIYVNLKTSLGVRKAELLVGEDKEGNLFYQMFLDYDREKARKKRNSADNQDRLSLNNIITDNQEDFNPMIKNNEVQNWNEADHPRDEAGKFTDIPSDSNGYSIKLKKSNKISLNMAKALQKGFYPEEQVSITLPKNTKEGKELNRLFEENKSFKKNYKLVYEHDDGQAFYDWDKKDLVKSELRYFDTKEELDAALEKLKDDPKFKGVITQKEVEEWHHISGGGKNRLIDINALKKLGFSVDTSTANKEFVLNGREIMAQNFNSKTVVQNFDPNQKRDKKGRWTKENYNAEIDRILKGELKSADRIKVVEHPSEPWLKAGLQDAEILMSVKTYSKATTDKHNVSEETMRNLPDLIDDPLYIFKSSTVPGSYVGVLDDYEEENGVKKPLIAVVKPEHGKIDVNLIPSVYGKDPDFPYREVFKNNLLYERLDKNKTVSNNIIASIAMETLKPSNNIITDIQEDFNPMIMGAYISNIIKIIPVVILNLFLKK